MTILGSNSAVPAYGRHHTSQLVQIGREKILVDCGEGVQSQLIKYGLGYGGINKILISHLHGDHYLGLMGLLFSMHLSGREETLHLYGQKGLDEIILTQLKYSNSRLNYIIEFHFLDPEAEKEVIYSTSKFKIISFPLNHRIPCCGFRFIENEKERRIIKSKIPKDFPIEYFHTLKSGKNITKEGKVIFNFEEMTLPPKKPRSYAYCSDTAFKEDIVNTIQGSDLLYHETTFLKDMSKWAVKTFHSTTTEAAAIALKANVKKLIIGHFSARHRDLEPYLEEAKSVFKNTELALEGIKFKIYEK